MHNKWHKEAPPIQVGNIALVSEDNMSHGKWPLAVIDAVHILRDVLVQTAIVTEEKGTFSRPVQRFHNLEIESTTRQANHEGRVPVHSVKKLKCDTVQMQNDHVPKSKPRPSVGLPDCVQGWEDVTARTRSERKIERPV